MRTDTTTRRIKERDIREISSGSKHPDPVSQHFPLLFSSINAGSVKPDNYREVEVSLQKIGYNVQQTYKLPKLVLYLCIDPLSRGIVVIQEHIPQIPDYILVKEIEGKFVQPPEKSKDLSTIIFNGSHIVIYNYESLHNKEIYRSNHGDETRQHGISLYSRYANIVTNVSKELEKDFVNDVTVYPLLEIGQNATNTLHDIAELINQNRDISNACSDNVKILVASIQSKRNEIVTLIGKGNQNAIDKFRAENESFMTDANVALSKNLEELNKSNTTTIKCIVKIIDGKSERKELFVKELNGGDKKVVRKSGSSSSDSVETSIEEDSETYSLPKASMLSKSVVIEAPKPFPSRTKTDRGDRKDSKRTTFKELRKEKEPKSEEEILIELDPVPLTILTSIKSIPDVDKKLEAEKRSDKADKKTDIPSKLKRTANPVTTKRNKKIDTSSDSTS